MTRFLLICLGGAFGTGARYLVGGWAARLFGSTLPAGTLAVNLLGSFLLGLLMETGLRTDLVSPTTRVVLATGVLGGFTTYSSFNYETLRLFEEGGGALAFANLAATVIGCLVMGALGLGLGRLVFSR